ncbi:MAG: SAM-dependent methyltransferase [Bacteroidota bacterium]
MKGKLYLIPNTLGHSDPWTTIPASVPEVTGRVRHYIVENVRTARRFLRLIDPGIVIDDLVFMELNKHTVQAELPAMLAPLHSGFDMGIISEAGVPGVADPGAQIVALAHREDIRVIPLTGPSSILLALMASGLNGQQFRFCGYLPVGRQERQKALKNLEQLVIRTKETQIFIEAPYRNDQLLEEILSACHADLHLTIAVDLTTPEEMVRTLTVGEWRKKRPALHKRPALFLIGSPVI